MNEDPSAIKIPSPQELGLGNIKVSADDPIDWSMVERRMDQLGVTSYQMQKAVDGFRFSIELRGKTVIGRGTSKAAAVRAAFAQVG